MEYTVAQLARLSGVSARALRYYDQIGLLKPAYINASGYRVYGEKQVDALQQILFFKELGLELGAIGAGTVERSNQRLMQLTERQYAEMGELTAELHALLAETVRAGSPPQGETGRQAAALHKRWLSFTWPTYSKEAHIGLMELYTGDPRFTAHYDHEVPGCARFLSEAVTAWAGKI